jgi:serine/threonine protein kinase/predicted RNA-binding Zn-ribbon protein involved in translation (DUF1610 family)
MNAPDSTCDPNAVERFLAGGLAESENLAFEDHLESCVSCRVNLDKLAAEDAWWDQARTYLSAAEPPVNGESNGTEAMLFSLKNYLAPTDDPRMLGRIGPYDISGIVGCGGMGIVLKAFDAPLNRYVAIKVLAPHLAMNPTSRGRFAREAKAAAAVVNLNVIAIHCVAEANGLPYFVMPYVSGPSLEKRLREAGPLPTIEILRIGRQIAAGLAAAHAQGVVHRDIKPANILLEEGTERVTITDFGLARAADDASMTQTGVVAGTPQYMSPEQARGEVVDARSDLFSLGSLLYACATGEPPFQATTSLGMLKRVEECRPRGVREVNPEVPPLLADIIGRLHAKSPADRSQSAAELADLFEKYLAHLAQPEGASAPVVPVASIPDEPRVGDQDYRRTPGVLRVSQTQTKAVDPRTERREVAPGANQDQGRPPHVTVGASLFLVFAVLAVGTAIWFAVRDAQTKVFVENEQPFPTVFHQDFRKPFDEPLPTGVAYWKGSEKRIRFLPEGMHIKIPRPVVPTERVGLVTGFGLRGDFDVSVSFDAFKAEQPMRTAGAGFNLGVELSNGETYTLARYVNDQVDGLGWQKDGANLTAPARVAAGTTRLVRAGSTLYRLWKPDSEATHFEIVDKAHIGAADVRRVYLNLFVGQTPHDIELRVLEWSIRGHKESNPGVGEPLMAPTRTGWATLLLVVLFIGLLTLCIVGWRRFQATRTAGGDPLGEKRQVAADTIPLPCTTCGASLKVHARLNGKQVKCPQCGATLVVPAEAPREGAVKTQMDEKKRSPFATVGASVLLALIVLALGTGLWFAVRGRSAQKKTFEERPEPLPMVFEQDFRKPSRLPLPEGLLFYADATEKEVQIRADGLHIKNAKPSIVKQGLGLATDFGLKGDFDVSVSFDSFHAPTATRDGLGFNCLVQTVSGDKYSFARRVTLQGEGLAWHNGNIGPSTFPTTSTAGTMRLVRTGSTLFRLWTPKTDGTDFQVVGKFDMGTEDLHHTYLSMFTGKMPLDIDVRVLEWRIRGQKTARLGANAQPAAPADPPNQLHSPPDEVRPIMPAKK